MSRENIPERIVHAKGIGAFGVFEATNDISDICKAKVFKVGTKTRVLTRFSIGADGSGPADTIREARGFAIKMYTDEGIWDLVTISSPVFYIRNPILFPALAAAQKRNTQTNMKDPNIFWNFISNNPETVHQVVMVNSDRGVPESFRFINGYGSHTFKMINSKNEYVWVKFHLRCDQNLKNLDAKTAKMLIGEQPGFTAADLSNAIAMKNFPSWTLYIQGMTEEQSRLCPFNAFDMTKIFSHKLYPLRKVGKLTLNENPTNHSSQIEAAAFTPSHLPPGIEVSPDQILQMRISAYADAQLRRVGANSHRIPVNNPHTNKNLKTDSHRDSDSESAVPNKNVRVEPATMHENLPFEDDFFQPRNFYRNVLDNQGRARLINNIARSLAQCTDQNVVHRTWNLLAHLDDDFGRKLAEKIKL
ncbi:unnamed protein product [Adineta steineri]|uniref:Catalase core domain-containing protein n=2 Tax=Adineta steineri TaxID=433720 RepID=A0A815R8D7_9BILA|nr:unnamed protein product [Adineta steineri]CAF1495270.1 unnamed protein product [Adineta steineri]